MEGIKRYGVFFLIFFSSKTFLFSQEKCEILPKPSPPRLVNDTVGLIGEVSSLEARLREIEEKTSLEIVVVLVKDLCGYEAWEYANLLGDKWGVGKKERDNGAVILIKPKLSKEDRGYAFIAPGRGLQGVIPDAIAKDIVDKYMIPSLRKGDYYGAILQAVDKIVEYAKEDPMIVEEYKKEEETPGGRSWSSFLILGIIIGVFGFFAVGYNFHKYFLFEWLKKWVPEKKVLLKTGKASSPTTKPITMEEMKKRINKKKREAYFFAPLAVLSLAFLISGDLMEIFRGVEKWVLIVVLIVVSILSLSWGFALLIGYFLGEWFSSSQMGWLEALFFGGVGALIGLYLARKEKEEGFKDTPLPYTIDETYTPSSKNTSWTSSTAAGGMVSSSSGSYSSSSSGSSGGGFSSFGGGSFNGGGAGGSW